MMFMCNETACSIQYKGSPLHVAVEKGHMDMVAILLKHGANTNTKNEVRNL